MAIPQDDIALEFRVWSDSLPLDTLPGGVDWHVTLTVGNLPDGAGDGGTGR